MYQCQLSTDFLNMSGHQPDTKRVVDILEPVEIERAKCHWDGRIAALPSIPNHIVAQADTVGKPVQCRSEPASECSSDLPLVMSPAEEENVLCSARTHADHAKGNYSPAL